MDTHSPFSVHTYRSRYRLFYPCGTFPYTPAAPLGVATPGIERDIDVTSPPAPPRARPHQAPRPQGRRKGARHPVPYRPYGFFAPTITFSPRYFTTVPFSFRDDFADGTWIVDTWTYARGIIIPRGDGNRIEKGKACVCELCNSFLFFFSSIFRRSFD